MRHILIRGIALVALALSTVGVVQAQQSPAAYPWAGQDAAVEPPTIVTPPPVQFNARDLSGLWLFQGGGGRAQALSDTPPPKTPAGDAIFRKSIVARVNELQTASEMPPPSQGNDPIMRCDPYGYPRVLWDFPAPMEFAHLSNRIVQFFEWTHVWRDIWMDGRALPIDPDPRWMGYSVGRWEGDTLVVETIGFDERAWLDEQGHRQSGKGRLIERYRRINARAMEWEATLSDPEYYTKPWVGTKRTFQLLPMPGWPQTELREEFCAPSIEQDFVQRIVNPAGGKEAN